MKLRTFSAYRAARPYESIASPRQQAHELGISTAKDTAAYIRCTGPETDDLLYAMGIIMTAVNDDTIEVQSVHGTYSIRRHD